LCVTKDRPIIQCHVQKVLHHLQAVDI
jgi:hypothetical protein